MSIQKSATVISGFILLATLLSGCQTSNFGRKTHSAYHYQPSTETTTHQENNVTAVNHNQPTLAIRMWHYDHVNWPALDSLNRTSRPATAYLDQQNIGAKQSARREQTVKPTGWHQKFVNGEPILNRGHLIAYSLTNGIVSSGRYVGKQALGDQNNWRNLFTQTAYSNQRLQTIYEQRVRDALYNGHKVIYQAQPIFHGNDLMATGIHLQAVSKDRIANFNVIIHNVQPNVTFDYATGQSVTHHTTKGDHHYGRHTTRND